jgi:hypothetical protein
MVNSLVQVDGSWMDIKISREFHPALWCAESTPYGVGEEKQSARADVGAFGERPATDGEFYGSGSIHFDGYKKSNENFILNLYIHRNQHRTRCAINAHPVLYFYLATCQKEGANQCSSMIREYRAHF